VGKAILANLLLGRKVRQLNQELDPDRPLPRSLDFFGLRFEVTPSG
jgi:hypothetical protein